MKNRKEIKLASMRMQDWKADVPLILDVCLDIRDLLIQINSQLPEDLGAREKERTISCRGKHGLQDPSRKITLSADTKPYDRSLKEEK